jgi:hypothetical protein
VTIRSSPCDLVLCRTLLSESGEPAKKTSCPCTSVLLKSWHDTDQSIRVTCERRFERCLAASQISPSQGDTPDLLLREPSHGRILYRLIIESQLQDCFWAQKYNSQRLAMDAGLLDTTISQVFPAFPTYSRLFFRQKTKQLFHLQWLPLLCPLFPKIFHRSTNLMKPIMTPIKNSVPPASAERNDATASFLSPLTKATNSFATPLWSLLLAHRTFRLKGGCTSKKIFSATYFLPTIYKPFCAAICTLHSKISIYSCRPP